MPEEEGSAKLSLRNDFLEVEISPENGSIIGIMNKKIRKQYIKEKKYGRLFRLIIPSSIWEGRHVDSWTQTVSKIERLNESSVILHYDSLSADHEKFAIEASVGFKLKDDSLIVKLLLKNRGFEEVTDVIFPWIGGLGEISDPETDAIYLPGETIRRIQKPLPPLRKEPFRVEQRQFKI